MSETDLAPAWRIADDLPLDRIEAYLRADPGLHLYAIGDLDDRYRSMCRFFAAMAGDRIAGVLVLYRGSSPATLLALTREDPSTMGAFVRALAPELDEATYMHLSPGVAEALGKGFELEPHGRHVKMLLTDRACLDEIAPAVPADLAAWAPRELRTSARFLRLGPTEREEIETLYREAYPDNFFDPRSLDTGLVVGARDEAGLVAIAGLHAFSRTKRVAAIGNVTTHPRARGLGLGRAITALLCRLLAGEADAIGLNVADDNAPALRTYASLGFTEVARYDEVVAKKPRAR